MTYSLQELLSSKSLRARLAQEKFRMIDEFGIFGSLDFEHNSLMKVHRALYDQLFASRGEALLDKLYAGGNTCLTKDPNAAKFGVRPIKGSQYYLKTNAGPSTHLASILFGLAGYIEDDPEYEMEDLHFETVSEDGSAIDDPFEEPGEASEPSEESEEIEYYEVPAPLHYTRSTLNNAPCFCDEAGEPVVMTVTRNSPFSREDDEPESRIGEVLNFNTLKPAAGDAKTFGWLYTVKDSPLTGWISPDFRSVYPPLAYVVNTTETTYRGDVKALLLRKSSQAALVDTMGISLLPIPFPSVGLFHFYQEEYHVQQAFNQLLIYEAPEEVQSERTSANYAVETEKYKMTGWYVDSLLDSPVVRRVGVNALSSGLLHLTLFGSEGAVLHHGHFLFPKTTSEPLIKIIADRLKHPDGWDDFYFTRHNNWCFVKRDGAWAILNTSADQWRMATPFAFHNILLADSKYKSYDVVFVEQYGRWGMFSLAENTPNNFGNSRCLLPCEYDSIEPFRSLYRAKRGRESFLFDAAGIYTELPNAKNFQELFKESGGSHIHMLNGEKRLDVQLRFNDSYNDDIDPWHFYKAKLSIVPKEGDYEALDGFGLTDLLAYLVTEKGVFYATENGIHFLNSATGISQNIYSFQVKYDRVVGLQVSGKSLVIECVDGFTRIASNEHRDLMGYTYEAWYDVYRVNTKTVSHTVSFDF